MRDEGDFLSRTDVILVQLVYNPRYNTKEFQSNFGGLVAMAEQHPHSLEQIPIADWEATPASVKHLVSSLLATNLNNHELPDLDLRLDGNSPPLDQENIRLTQFLDAASVGIGVHDAAGNLVYMNQAGKELLTDNGKSVPEVEKIEVIAQSFRVFNSVTNQPYPLEKLPSSLALAGQKAQADDLEIHQADRLIPLEVLANPIFNAQGQVEYVIATFQDITDRRNSEQALRESNILYQQIAEAQTDFIVRSLPDTTIIFVNPARCRALGLSLEEIVGKKWIEITNSESSIDTLWQIPQLTLENPTFLAENPYGRADGTIGWTQWLNQGIFNTQRELVEIHSVGRDITTLKQTEIALQESEAKFRNIVANIPGAVFRYVLKADGSDQVLYMSPGCYDLWEVEADVVEASAKILWEVIHPEDVPNMYNSVMASAQTLQPWFCEWRITTPSGQKKWLQGIGNPEFTPEGDVVWDTLVLDVSDRKQIELELQKQKELLQTIFDHMPVMAGIYSQTGEILMVNRHLEKIVGWTKTDYETIDVLRECYPDPADYAQVMEYIVTADSVWHESKLRTKDGRIIDTTWVQIRLADGRSMSIGQDITEQKRLVTSLAQINQELEIRVAERTKTLQQQEALLRESQKVARLGSWEFILDTGEVIWSPELFQIFGYDRDDVAPSLSVQSRNFMPEDWLRLNYFVDRAINHGEPYELDLQIIREDGSLGYIFAKGQPTVDEDGQLRRLVGIAMDISDRKAAEAALAESEAQNRAILRAIPDIMFRVNRAGIYLSYSMSKELLLSFGNEQIIGQPMRDYLPPEHYQHKIHHMSVALETRQTQIYEQEVTIAGNLQQEEVRVVPIEDREEVLFMIRDISDRKQAEQELIQNRDLREAIFNELADALFLVDPETLLTLDCNQKAIELFEVKNKADLIGIAGHILQRYQFTLEELAAIDQDMRANGFWSREIEYVTRKGNYFWGNIAAKPIMVAGRTMNLVRLTDISDRKQSEAKIQQVAQQLETANRELEAFAYSVSHDLRAPLRAIDGFSKALIEDYGEQFDEEAKDYFDRIHRAVERMGDLIDDLLRLSRVSRAEVQHGRVNLTKLVQEIAANLRELEPERQVEFAIVPEAIVSADQNLIRIVLENLLQNAWKFTSQHPTARIEFGIIENRRETQGATPQLEILPEIVYFIRDDGAGFDMAYATMLFGVFQRLHNTNEFPGTGIGLATVQRVIHRHGGQVWAEGTVEAGATIYFTLPNHIRSNA